jgi:hypothetical protein
MNLIAILWYYCAVRIYIFLKKKKKKEEEEEGGK